MLTHTQARIYLNAQRGHQESEGFRRLSTFSFETYQQEGRVPFGRLLVFNEETLAAGQKSEIKTLKPTEVILFPIVGGIELMDRFGESIFVSPGESFNFLTFPESAFTIINPYPDETIRYFQIHLSPEVSIQAVDNNLDQLPLTEFSLEARNMLVSAFTSIGETVWGFLGQFDGRNEAELKLLKPAHGFFVFVIEGAFEVQNRLLEKGDALSLMHVETLELEALSNGAIILVMEVGQSL